MKTSQNCLCILAAFHISHMDVAFTAATLAQPLKRLHRRRYHGSKNDVAGSTKKLDAIEGSVNKETRCSKKTKRHKMAKEALDEPVKIQEKAHEEMSVSRQREDWYA